MYDGVWSDGFKAKALSCSDESPAPPPHHKYNESEGPANSEALTASIHRQSRGINRSSPERWPFNERKSEQRGEDRDKL